VKPALLPVADHQARILSLLTDGFTRRSELVPTTQAAGRVLAASLASPEPLPAFDNSAMDGYAVRAADIAGASADTPVRLPVEGEIPAGAAPGTLTAGTAHRIMTGAPVPPGADAVVEVEQTDGGTDIVTVHAAREPGSFVRARAGDVAVGDPVLAADTLLGPAQLGLLAALGAGEVEVWTRPRVLVVSTGSELAADPRPEAGQIRDANGAMLAAAVEEAGAVAVRRLWVADDVPAFLALLDAEREGIDLVLTSGGVSAGAYEVVKDGLGSRGVDFVKVAMQPGMPQGAGLYKDLPVVCLPGNPVSSLVSFEVFVRPALRAAAGLPRTTRTVMRAELSEAIESVPGKRQLRRGRLDRASAVVRPWGPPGSGFLGWLAGADCLIDIPEDVTAVGVGEPVDVWDLMA